MRVSPYLFGPRSHRLRRAAVRPCLLYTSDAADERSSVDLGGRRIIKKKKKDQQILKHNTIDHISSKSQVIEKRPQAR